MPEPKSLKDIGVHIKFIFHCTIVKQLLIGNSFVLKETEVAMQKNINSTVKENYKEHLLRKMKQIVA